MKILKHALRKSVTGSLQYVKEHKMELVQLGIMAAIVIAPIVGAHGVAEATISGGGNGTIGGDSGTTMPWSSGANKLASEITGPIPKIFAVIGGAVSGIMLGLGMENSLTKRAIQFVLGASIAIGSANLVNVITGERIAGLLF